MADYTIYGASADHGVVSITNTNWLDARAGTGDTLAGTAGPDAITANYGDGEWHAYEAFLGPFDTSAVPAGTDGALNFVLYIDHEGILGRAFDIRAHAWTGSSANTGSWVAGADLAGKTLWATHTTTSGIGLKTIAITGVGSIPRQSDLKFLVHGQRQLSATSPPTDEEAVAQIAPAESGGTTNDPRITFTVTTSVHYTLTSGGGSFALAGQATSGRLARKVVAAHAPFGLNGRAATLGSARRMSAAAGTVSLAGQVAACSHGRRLAADRGQFALSGQAATLPRAAKVPADHGVFSLAGQAADPVPGRRLPAAAGTFGVAGQPANFRLVLRFGAAPGLFAMTGQAAGSVRGPRLEPLPGSFTLFGQDVAIHATVTLPAAAGSVALAGVAATLRRSLPLIGDGGAFTWDGQAAGFRTARRLMAEGGVLSATGIAANLALGRPVSAAHGSFALAGQAATFLRSYGLAAGHVGFTLGGCSAALVAQSTNPGWAAVDSAQGVWSAVGSAPGQWTPVAAQAANWVGP